MVRIKPILCPQHLRSVLSNSNGSRTTPTLLQRASSVFFSSSASASASASPPTPHRRSNQYHHQQLHHPQRQRRPYSSQPPPPPRDQASAAPAPTPFVPDVQTFLTLIGRGLSQHAAKFPTWESLFATTAEQLRELGIEPPRTRRYLLLWRQRFRNGQYGVGGDLRHVVGGRAELRVLETRPGEEVGFDQTAAPTPTPAGSESPSPAPAATRRRAKYVVNVPPGKNVRDCRLDELSRVRGYKVRGARTIVGPYALPMKDGQGSAVVVTENMWEFGRGHKIDGGERRRTEVRYKKRIAERREMRERGEL